MSVFGCATHLQRGKKTMAKSRDEQILWDNPIFHISTDRYWQMLFNSINKSLLNCTFLKHIKFVQNLCSTVHTCMFVFVFYYRIDPASPLLSYTVKGPVLKCKTNVAWTFIFTHINDSHVHSHFILKLHVRSSDEIQHFHWLLSESHKYSICVVPVTVCTEAMVDGSEAFR